MKLLAVTACPTGIAHTYMAADQLELAAQRRGVSIKVETQGALGIENRLSARDLRESPWVLLATDIALHDEERFRNIQVHKVPIQAVIEDPDAILARYLV